MFCTADSTSYHLTVQSIKVALQDNKSLMNYFTGRLYNVKRNTILQFHTKKELKHHKIAHKHTSLTLSFIKQQNMCLCRNSIAHTRTPKPVKYPVQ